MDISINIVLFGVGLFLVASTFLSAIKTFVLPRNSPTLITTAVFKFMRILFLPWTHSGLTYRQRDKAMALYAPFSLLLLPAVWLTLVLFGYMLMFWALGIHGWRAAFTVSGSSLLTLGFAAVTDIPLVILAFTEATIGLILVALLIAYLPTMYGTFSRRENLVTLLDVRGGSPPSAAEMLVRTHRFTTFDIVDEIFIPWEEWFVELEETHTSLPALAFFRSPQPMRCWINSAEALLDLAALRFAVVDVPLRSRAQLVLRTGFLALRRVANSLGIEVNNDPHFPEDEISVTRQQFDDLYDLLRREGVPVFADQELAWLNYAGWRVTYDQAVMSIKTLIVAPQADWLDERLAKYGELSITRAEE